MELKHFVGSKIKELRTLANLNQDDLAEVLGTTKQSISRYETGQRKADQDLLFELADYFEESIDYFFPLTKQDPDVKDIYLRLPPHLKQQFKKYGLNLLMKWDSQGGQLTESEKEYYFNNQSIIIGRKSAAGETIEVDDDLAEYEVVSSSVIPKGADELVEITGDSMEPLIYKGEKVYIRHQPDVENGEIAIVRLDDKGVTCKRVYKDKGKLVLKSENTDYEDIVIEKDEVSILAKVLI